MSIFHGFLFFPLFVLFMSKCRTYRLGRVARRSRCLKGLEFDVCIGWGGAGTGTLDRDSGTGGGSYRQEEEEKEESKEEGKVRRELNGLSGSIGGGV